MHIKEEKRDSVTVLTLDALYVGASEAGVIMDTLHELRERGDKWVVVDLARVQTMNSSGLGALISGLNIMRQAGGDLKLAGVNEKVEKLLTITKLRTVFDCHATVNEAVQSFTPF
ncbi:MAG TPA: STAS domain-containing protein [bacterium]|nr:STAS domain-containing protein [bacterium]HQG45293.1 STAS domain-containing protein [bacterium]HQI50049.1 STAS domain-containing protein [bacterium]HQJ62995.1 STAS domain-containing protein [bacterium]